MGSQTMIHELDRLSIWCLLDGAANQPARVKEDFSQ